jgi:cell division protease FtsH
VGSGWTRNGFVYLLIIAAAAALFFSFFPRQEKAPTADLTQVAEWISQGNVRSIEVSGEALKVDLKNGETYTSNKDGATPFQETMTRLGIEPELLLFLMRQAQGSNSQAMSFGKSKARMFTGDKPTVTFDDVAGATRPRKS